MDLQRYVENIQHQLAVAAEAGGDDAGALAERLMAPLEAAIRLALQDALVAAAEEITCELAPGSVELRLRGRDPEFVVTAPPVDATLEDLSDRHSTPDGWPGAATDLPSLASGEPDDGAMSRINLRMPDHLKARIEHAAGSQGISVNAWLVRAATAAVARGDADRPAERRSPQSAQRYTGWAR
jgi:HicB family